MSLSLALVLLNGCLSVQRSSELAIQLQQLTVNSDGDWDVELRVHNLGASALTVMRVHVNVMVSEGVAGQIDSTEEISIPAESVDIVTVHLKPTPAGRLLVVDALAAKHSLTYTLQGAITAHVKNHSHTRERAVLTSHRLDPVPGLVGTLR